VISAWEPKEHQGSRVAVNDRGAAKYYPEDDEYVIDRDSTVAHFEVAEAALGGDAIAP
jgi:hypothetical protein